MSTFSCFELFLFQDTSSIVLTSEVITDIKKGLTLGDYLLLPDELRFTASRMSFLLFPPGQMRPLQHIRLVYLHEFIVSVVSKLRKGREGRSSTVSLIKLALGLLQTISVQSSYLITCTGKIWILSIGSLYVCIRWAHIIEIAILEDTHHRKY